MFTRQKEIQQLMGDGAHLVISISGGKDSDTMLYDLVTWYSLNRFPGKLMAVHADLGRVEHPESLPQCRAVCQALGIPLHVVKRDIDLLDGWIKRRATLDAQGKHDKPHWSSSAARYCTSDWKRSPIDKFIRNQFPSDATVICAIGLRAEESPARKKRESLTLRTGCQAPTKNRVVYNWLPIQRYSLEDVWATIGYSLSELKALQEDYQTALKTDDKDAIWVLENTFRAHIAYLRGNDRVSCVFCVLAGSSPDWRIGAIHHPDHYRELVNQELSTGFSFTNAKWLADVAPHLLTEEEKILLAQLKGSRIENT